MRDGEGVTAPNWRTEAARAGIRPWPYCRRTMASLGGKAVEVPDLSDPGTLSKFDIALAVRCGMRADRAAGGVTVTIGDFTLGFRRNGDTFTGIATFIRTPHDPLLARVEAWASVTT